MVVSEVVLADKITASQSLNLNGVKVVAFQDGGSLPSDGDMLVYSNSRNRFEAAANSGGGVTTGDVSTAISTALLTYSDTNATNTLISDALTPYSNTNATNTLISDALANLTTADLPSVAMLNSATQTIAGLNLAKGQNATFAVESFHHIRESDFTGTLSPAIAPKDIVTGGLVFLETVGADANLSFPTVDELVNYLVGGSGVLGSDSGDGATAPDNIEEGLTFLNPLIIAVGSGAAQVVTLALSGGGVGYTRIGYQGKVGTKDVSADDTSTYLTGVTSAVSLQFVCMKTGPSATGAASASVAKANFAVIVTPLDAIQFGAS